MTAIELHNTLPAAPAEQDPDEKRVNQQLRAHRAMGLLMQLIPADMPFTAWTITGEGVDAMYNVHPHNASDSQARTDLRRLARILDGFEFSERPHLGGQNKARIVGTVSGVDVELWVLVHPCTCHCHAGDGAR